MTSPESSPETEENLPPLTDAVVKNLTNRVISILEVACKATPGRPASAATKKLVAKRTPPRTLPDYDVLEPYPLLVWDELAALLDRIVAYPVVAQYRRHLTGAPKPVLAAWQIHSQSLRPGELYIVQDRTVALLGFMRQVAIDAGLPTTDREKAFEKAFKKTFERRLRERHRLVHAHERPSLESRIINLGSIAKDAPAQAAVHFGQAFGWLHGALAQTMARLGREPPKSMEDVAALHEEGAQREAAQMLSLVGEALLGTLNAWPPPQPQSTGAQAAPAQEEA